MRTFLLFLSLGMAACAVPLSGQTTSDKTTAKSEPRGVASGSHGSADGKSANQRSGETTDKEKKQQDKKKAEPPKSKYLVEIYDLQSEAILSAGPSSCYTGALKFPVTNAEAVVKNIGPVPDYTFVPMAPDQIAIYYKKSNALAQDLERYKGYMAKFAAADFQYAKAISVPSRSAAKVLKQVDLPPDSGIKLVAVNEGCILILSKSKTPDPVTIAELENSLPKIYWETDNTQSTFRLFHLDATTVAKKLAGNAESPADKSGDSDASSKAEKTAKADKTSKTGKSNKTNPKASAKSGKAGDAQETKKTGGEATAADDGATDNSADEEEQGNSDPNKKAGAAQQSNKDSSTAPTAEKADPDKTGNNIPVKPPTVLPINDTLIYSNEDGSDKGFFERNRLMAVLDLPRPEVLMNIWSLQVSTRNPKVASLEAEWAGELISHHNDVLENSIELGWDHLSRQIAAGHFFEPRFYEYVTKKFGASDGAKRIDADARMRWGWCGPDQYCLGFIHAFEPLRPTLTNILLALAAADDSQNIADQTIVEMQKPPEVLPETLNTGIPKNCKDSGTNGQAGKPEECEAKGPQVSKFESCIGRELSNLQVLKKQSATDDCELNDRIATLDVVDRQQPEGLQLRCFRNQSAQSFGPGLGKASTYAATRVGLLRAAIADFLFNYKWATQYPHNFIPYDLTQSAQELNAEFNPLVLAFNRDVKAFTQNLQTELECKHEANRSPLSPLDFYKAGDETFLNDGIVSVRGISGVESVVDTVTQSFFDATQPPNLTDLVKSVSDAEKNVPGVLKANLSANEAAVLLGALNSVQPAQARIGRELKLDIVPHALAGASSAELEVKLSADEAGSPTRFKAGKQEEDILSRVARHDTNTRVRVESLKLFDVSAFSAMLQRPRSKFPIIPPFFEVPYFGSFLGVPLPGAKVYHRSTAIVSAIIVPTAADLAFGIEFANDRLCEASRDPKHGLECHSAHSPYDFDPWPLRNFHKAMIQCFASGGKTFYAGTLLQQPAGAATGDTPCSRLSLDGTSISPPPN